MATEFKYSYDENKCPYCGSEDIDMGHLEFDSFNEEVFQEGECNNCHREFTRFYTLEFDNIEYEITEEDRKKEEEEKRIEVQKKFADENQLKLLIAYREEQYKRDHEKIDSK